ncbi:MAG: class II fructose-bisphosphate aldolase [Oscillospiraceae bacterium]|nr:class II fructose-bisphosphate aldolase [Oscillospiraceae bacterium]
MSIIRDAQQTRDIYRQAGERGWVLPCLCSENLTTTEAILSAAEEYRKKHGMERLPIILAITCQYDHRSQSVNYTHTRRWDTGLKLFTNDAITLAENGGPFEKLDVMLHLDHIQHDADTELLATDLKDYASIMYDASTLPFDENIRKTAEFVSRRKKDILIEGACDEIVDATGSVRNALTTPENAKRFCDETGVDLIVANLGTEHRATGKDLQYRGDISRQVKEAIGSRIVLHGTSSVKNEEVRRLYQDGVCKVNIWTAMERDSSPILFEEMVRNACRTAGEKTVRQLIADGLLTEKACSGESISINRFTTVSRQEIIFEKMKEIVGEYLDMWYV